MELEYIDGQGQKQGVQLRGDSATGAALVKPSAGESHLGEVAGSSALLDVALSLDTSIYADGDVLADSQVVSGALRVNDGTGILQSVVLMDEDDQGVALDLLFFNANVSLGTENSAPSITDANARNFLGLVRVLSSDWIDLGGVRVATFRGLGMLVKATSGTPDIYVAAITRGGTPTYTASGIRARFGFLRD